MLFVYNYYSKFLKGKSKADLAPTKILFLLFIIPFQIILLFWCNLSAYCRFETKKSSNRDLKSLVKKISGKVQELDNFH